MSRYWLNTCDNTFHVFKINSFTLIRWRHISFRKIHGRNKYAYIPKLPLISFMELLSQLPSLLFINKTLSNRLAIKPWKGAFRTRRFLLDPLGKQKNLQAVVFSFSFFCGGCVHILWNTELVNQVGSQNFELWQQESKRDSYHNRSSSKRVSNSTSFHSTKSASEKEGQWIVHNKRIKVFVNPSM